MRKIVFGLLIFICVVSLTVTAESYQNPAVITAPSGASLRAGPRPSAETFRMSLFIFVQAADYEEARSRVKTLAAACESALETATFAAVVPSWRIPRYRLDAGTDGSNIQLCLELPVECRCW